MTCRVVARLMGDGVGVQAAAADARREAAALAATVDATKTNVEQAHAKMEVLLRSVEKMQVCVPKEPCKRAP
jgi:hypothetical protein